MGESPAIRKTDGAFSRSCVQSPGLIAEHSIQSSEGEISFTLTSVRSLKHPILLVCLRRRVTAAGSAVNNWLSWSIISKTVRSISEHMRARELKKTLECNPAFRSVLHLLRHECIRSRILSRFFVHWEERVVGLTWNYCYFWHIFFVCSKTKIW